MFCPFPLSRSGKGLIASLLVCACSAGAAHSQNAPLPPGPRQATKSADKIPMRDIARESDLKELVATSANMDKQMAANTKPLPEVKPKAESSILTSSIILGDGDMFTVVPIGSVLNLPPSYRRRILEEPEGAFTFWPDFLERNKSWLTTREVPLKMAKGDAKSGEAIMRAVSTERKVVVAVYKTGPISVLEPVPGSEDSTKKIAAESEAPAEEAQSTKKNKR